MITNTMNNMTSDENILTCNFDNITSMYKKYIINLLCVFYIIIAILFVMSIYKYMHN